MDNNCVCHLNINGVDYEMKDKQARTSIGDITSLNTQNKDTLVNAINEVNDKTNEVNNKASDITTNIGNKNNLNTTNKNDLVSAINEVNDNTSDNTNNIGNKNNLNTTNKNDLVSAINEINIFKNLFNINDYPLTINKAHCEGGVEAWGGYSALLDYFPVDENTIYSISNNENIPINNGGLTFYDSSKNVLSYTGNVNTFTTPANCKFIRFSFLSTTISWIQIEKNITPSGFFPNNVFDILKWKDNAIFNNIDNTFTVPISWNDLKELSFRVLGSDNASFGFLTIPKELWHNNGTYELDVKCYDVSNNYMGYKRFKVTTKNSNNFVITVSGTAGEPKLLYR